MSLVKVVKKVLGGQEIPKDHPVSKELARQDKFKKETEQYINRYK